MKWMALAVFSVTSALAGEPDAGVLASRPFRVVVPSSPVPAERMPLLVLLHGLGATAASQDAYFKMSALAEERGFLLALPDGTVNARGMRFWNATDACCAFGATVDDVAYLTAVIHDVQARFPVDPKRIFVVGHSNGGFMALRLACERSELIAGVVSIAGAAWSDPAKCTPRSAVSVLQVHGTLDTTIKYAGGKVMKATQPGAEATIAQWAAKNRCTGKRIPAVGGELDLVAELPGAETQREAVAGCPEGTSVELWRIRGGPHIPAFNSAWAGAIYDWLMAHPKT